MLQVLNKSTPQFLVAADQHVDFVREILGESGVLTAVQTESASKLKSTVLQAFLTAIEGGLPLSASGFCTDAEFGEASILRAKGMGLFTGLSLGTSLDSWGGNSLAWDYSTKLEIPMFAVRVHYNINGEYLEKKRTLDKLSALSKICRAEENRALLIEIAPSMDKSRDDENTITMDIIETAHEFLDSGIDSSIWAIPPVRDEAMITAAVSVFYIDDRSPNVFFSIGGEPRTGDPKTGAASDDLELAELAARIPGVTGLLVGPGVYYQELVSMCQQKATEEAVVNSISERLVNIWNHYSNVASCTD